MAVKYLADKSALARVGHAAVGMRITALIGNGQIATCEIIDLEVLYSAQSNDAYERLRGAQRRLSSEPITNDHLQQALAIQRQLAEIGKHRVPIPDLIIASVALLGPDLTVLHYDHDFDIIAEVCELSHEWVVPQGTVP